MHLMMGDYFSRSRVILCWSQSEICKAGRRITQISVSQWKSMDLKIFNICHIRYESWLNIDVIQPWGAKWMTDGWHENEKGKKLCLQIWRVFDQKMGWLVSIIVMIMINGRWWWCWCGLIWKCLGTPCLWEKIRFILHFRTLGNFWFSQKCSLFGWYYGL